MGASEGRRKRTTKIAQREFGFSRERPTRRLFQLPDAPAAPPDGQATDPNAETAKADLPMAAPVDDTEAPANPPRETTTATEELVEAIAAKIETNPRILHRLQTPRPAAGDLPNASPSVADAAQLLRLCAGLAQNEPSTDATMRRMARIIVRGFQHDTDGLAMLRQLSGSAADFFAALWPNKTPVPSQVTSQIQRLHEALAGSQEDTGGRQFDKLSVLLRELHTAGHRRLVSEALGVVAARLEDDDRHHRIQAARILGRALPLLTGSEYAPLRSRLTETLTHHLPDEPDAPAYEALVAMAASLVDTSLLADEHHAAEQLLALLHDHYQDDAAPFTERPVYAYQALDSCARGAGFRMILDRLRNGDADAERMVQHLTQAAMQPLVEEIARLESETERVRCAQTLRQLGDQAASVLLEAVRDTADATRASRLVEAIPHFLSAANAESALRHLLKHPLDRVRALAGRVLASRGFQHSGPHLLDALAEETDPHVQVGLIEALGQLRYRSALRRLLPLIEDRRARDDHRAAACLALGQIGDDMALDPLCKLVDSGAGKLTRMFGSQTGLLVRAAAARALGKFMRHEEARAALRHAADDANPIVRMAVGDALAGGISLTGRDNGPEAPEAPRLAGSLAEISIDQICQLLAGSSKTGLLLLHLEDGVAKVWLDQGMLVAAEFNDAREQAALNTIINRQQGTFVFQPDHEAPEQRTRLPMSTVLLEACRQADEAGR